MTKTDASWVNTVVGTYVAELKVSIQSIDHGWIEWAAAVTGERLRTGGARLFAQGNGGSSCVVDAFIHELMLKVGGNLQGRLSATWPVKRHINAVRLRGFTESNLQLLQEEGLSAADLLYLVSGSGNSTNLIRVMLESIRINAEAFTITGADGGRLASLSSNNLLIHSNDQQVIEDTATAALLMLAKEIADTVDAKPRAHGQDIISGETKLLAALSGLDAQWINTASDKLADAIVGNGTVHVMAPEGGSTGAIAEHIEHNLAWDLTHGYDLVPDVRWGISAAQYTAVVNDTGDPHAPGRRTFKGVRGNDFALLLANHADTLKDVEASDIGARPLAIVGQRKADKQVDYACADIIAILSEEPSVQLVIMQALGHLLLRCARAKLTAIMSGNNDSSLKEQVARLPIAPMTHYRA